MTAAKTVVITGANSGIGFEAAARFASGGWGTVILACRSVEKGEAARAALVERVGGDPFETLVMDTSEVASAEAAASALRARDGGVDALVLNAGASGAEARFNSDGIELTWASTLVGHHVLVMRLLEDGQLNPGARIVIAGSEGARGNLPGMSVHDIAAIADAEFDGDRMAAIQALARIEASRQKPFANMDEYVTAKRVVAWWAAALARELPAGMTVNAVSPGAVLSTAFARDAPAWMRVVMLPVMKLVGPLVGMSGSVGEAAQRYVDAVGFGPEVNGAFFATAHRKKAVGPMAEQRWPEALLDERLQAAALHAMVAMTGHAGPAQAAR